MKKGDPVFVEWNDGLTSQGVYIKQERGFIVFKNKEGKEQGWRPESIRLMNVITGSILTGSEEIKK